VLALQKMYLKGVSTRKVTTILETLCVTSVSASEVSALVRRLDGDLEVWHTRPLTAKAYPYLVIDAHVERVRREGQVPSTAVLWVIGVGADGYREHLGVWLNPTESGLGWRRVFEQLLQRGLAGVQSWCPMNTRAWSRPSIASSPTPCISAVRCTFSAMRSIASPATPSARKSSTACTTSGTRRRSRRPSSG
jgi:transposase-like protein